MLALGLTGCGKSWFCNQLLGRREFEEGTRVKSSLVAEKSKSICDNVNDTEYSLVLHDTPSLNAHAANRVEILDTILKTLRQKDFHQIVIIHNFSQTLDEDVRKYYEILAICLLQHVKQASSSVTLVINRISVKAKDDEIIECREQFLKLIGLQSNDFICIQQGEMPRDCVFRYLIHSKEDGYQFQDRNFLATIGQSSPIETESLKLISEIYAQAKAIAKPEGAFLTYLASFLTRSFYGISSGIGFAIFSVILVFFNIGVSVLIAKEPTWIVLILFFIVFFLMILFRFYEKTLKTFFWSSEKTQAVMKKESAKIVKYYDFLSLQAADDD